MLLRKARTFHGLPSVTRQAAVLTVLAVPVAAVTVHWRGLKQARRMLGSGADRHLGQMIADGDKVIGVVRGFKLGLRFAPYKGNCLSRSLALSWLLRRQAIESDLRIGVRNHEGEFQAHAWVEYQNQVLNDASDVASRYRPFDEHLGPEWVGVRIREGQP